MPAARWWALVSALLAPVVLIGGWTVAAARQPGHYDAVRETISALAARGAHDRWIMTAGLALLGAAHLLTALGLPAARPAGRGLLAVGGLATALVAAAPQPAHGSSTVHVSAAAVGFVALALWPLAASRRAPSAGSAVMGRRCGLFASGVLVALLVWLGLELGGAQLGLAERVLAGAQALWPLVAVSSVRRWMHAERTGRSGFVTQPARP